MRFMRGWQEAKNQRQETESPVGKARQKLRPRRQAEGGRREGSTPKYERGETRQRGKVLDSAGGGMRNVHNNERRAPERDARVSQLTSGVKLVDTVDATAADAV